MNANAALSARGRSALSEQQHQEPRNSRNEESSKGSANRSRKRIRGNTTSYGARKSPKDLPWRSDCVTAGRWVQTERRKQTIANHTRYQPRNTPSQNLRQSHV